MRMEITRIMASDKGSKFPLAPRLSSAAGGGNKKKNTTRLPHKPSQVRSGTRHKHPGNELEFFMPCREGTLVSREGFEGEPMTPWGSSHLFVFASYKKFLRVWSELSMVCVVERGPCQFLKSHDAMPNLYNRRC